MKTNAKQKNQSVSTSAPTQKVLTHAAVNEDTNWPWTRHHAKVFIGSITIVSQIEKGRLFAVICHWQQL